MMAIWRHRKAMRVHCKHTPESIVLTGAASDVTMPTKQWLPGYLTKWTSSMFGMTFCTIWSLHIVKLKCYLCCLVWFSVNVKYRWWIYFTCCLSTIGAQCDTLFLFLTGEETLKSSLCFTGKFPIRDDPVSSYAIKNRQHHNDIIWASWGFKSPILVYLTSIRCNYSRRYLNLVCVRRSCVIQ